MSGLVQSIRKVGDNLIASFKGGDSEEVRNEPVISAKYTATSGTMTNNAIFDFPDKAWDTHNAVTTGASWEFVAPIDGFYYVSSNTQSNNASVTAGEFFFLQCNSGATKLFRGETNEMAVTTTAFFGVACNGIAHLAKGQGLSIVHGVSGATVSVNGEPHTNYIFVQLLGRSPLF